MMYAAVATAPRDAGRGTDRAIAAMRKAPGVVNVISFEACSFEPAPVHATGIAVVARGYWLARQALARLMAQFASAADIPRWNALVASGDADPRVAHGTAQFVDGRLQLWHATLDAVSSRAAVSRIAGIAEALVDLHVVGTQQSEAGLGVLVSAIAMAREFAPAPVQVIVVQDFFQPTWQSTVETAPEPALGAIRLVSPVVRAA